MSERKRCVCCKQNNSDGHPDGLCWSCGMNYKLDGICPGGRIDGV
jgi:hypothetical protein